MSNVKEHARDLHGRLPDEIDVEVEEVREMLQNFYEYDVEGDEAERPVLQQLAEKYRVDIDELIGEVMGGGSNSFTDVDIEEIEQIDSDEFVTVEAQVAELWDNDTDAIQQVGLLEDNTGRIKFKSWSKSEKPLLTEGQSVRLEGVATDEFNGSMELSINSQTEFEFIDEEFESPDPDNENRVHHARTIVSIQDGEGLINRCVECNRVLNNGSCSEHGNVNGEFDLRVKGVLDSGTDTQQFVMNDEVVEEVTGMSLDTAKQMAKDELNPDVVLEELRDELVPSYWTVEGFDYGDIFIVEDAWKPDGAEVSIDLQEKLSRLDKESYVKGD